VSKSRASAEFGEAVCSEIFAINWKQHRLPPPHPGATMVSFLSSTKLIGVRLKLCFIYN